MIRRVNHNWRSKINAALATSGGVGLVVMVKGGQIGLTLSSDILKYKILLFPNKTILLI
jgi:hypothetical protein